MSAHTSPLGIGDTLPQLPLTAPGGETSTVPLRSTGNTLVYFMRTPTCPVCHSHLRHMERARLGTAALTDATVVIVPGTSDDAESVQSRHPNLAGRIFASETAHEQMGLFVKGGFQQSGSFVVNAHGRVMWARTATIPLGSYDEAQALEALAAPIEEG